MKLNEIKEVGFYCRVSDKDRNFIYEVIENTDEEWLKETPEQTFLINEWIWDRNDEDNRRIYEIYGGNLVWVGNADSKEVTKIEDVSYVMIDKEFGCIMREDKPTRIETLEKRIKNLAEENIQLKREIEFLRSSIFNSQRS